MHSSAARPATCPAGFGVPFVARPRRVARGGAVVSFRLASLSIDLGKHPSGGLILETFRHDGGSLVPPQLARTLVRPSTTVHRSRAELESLDAALPADIGLCRSTVEIEASKPFWMP